MPRPLKMILAHSERKNSTSLFVTPLYTMAAARYIMWSLQFCKVRLNQIQRQNLTFLGADKYRFNLHRLRPRVRGTEQRKHTL